MNDTQMVLMTAALAVVAIARALWVMRDGPQSDN